MRKNILIGVVLGFALLLAACASPSSKTTMTTAPGEDISSEGQTMADDGEAYHKITDGQAKQMIDDGGVSVVDVRTKDEYIEKHIPGAILVPNESIGDEAPEALPDKDAVLLIHCRTGVRSKQASDKLVKLGYTHVYDFGGIIDWAYETETGE